MTITTYAIFTTDHLPCAYAVTFPTVQNEIKQEFPQKKKRSTWTSHRSVNHHQNHLPSKMSATIAPGTCELLAPMCRLILSYVMGQVPVKRESVQNDVPCKLGKVCNWDTFEDSVLSRASLKTTASQACAKTNSPEFGRSQHLEAPEERKKYDIAVEFSDSCFRT